MGSNLLAIASTLLFPSIQHDTTDRTEDPSHGVGYERASDLLQYNRVQGLSLGLGYRVALSRSTTLYPTVRYGLSDERVTWRLSLIQLLGRGTVRLSGYNDLIDLDRVSPGRTFGNTVNGLFAGHDNGDYALGRGAALSWDQPLSLSLGLRLDARVERETSATRTARSEVNDFLGGSGLFPPNPPVQEGTFVTGSVSLVGRGDYRWQLSLDVLGGDGQAVGRFLGDVSRTVGSAPSFTLRLKSGAATRPVPPQRLFRLGGVNTVRGFEYGTTRGAAFWAGQLDVVLLDGRIQPLLFVDAGQSAELADLLSSPAFVGAGAGLAVLRGLLRLELSRPVTPDLGGKLRFDLVVRGWP